MEFVTSDSEDVSNGLVRFFGQKLGLSALRVQTRRISPSVSKGLEEGALSRRIQRLRTARIEVRHAVNLPPDPYTLDRHSGVGLARRKTPSH